MVELACSHCGAEFSRPRYTVTKQQKNGYRNSFCSRNCGLVFHRLKRQESGESKKYFRERYINDKEYRDRVIRQSKNSRDAKKYRKHRLDNRKRALDLLGGKCSVCGYDKCQAAIDFHHIDKHRKDRIVFSGAWGKIEEEIKKCVLLCANCHREFHFTESEVLHG